MATLKAKQKDLKAKGFGNKPNIFAANESPGKCDSAFYSKNGNISK